RLRRARADADRIHLPRHGVWRSLVAHSLWERGAVGSNPATPTDTTRRSNKEYACEEPRRDSEPDPGEARHRGAVRRAQAEPAEGVPGRRGAGASSGLP